MGAVPPKDKSCGGFTVQKSAGGGDMPNPSPGLAMPPTSIHSLRRE
jgi:hypothetical protein